LFSQFTPLLQLLFHGFNLRIAPQCSASVILIFKAVVASDKACPDAIAIYAKRWETETLFSYLKGRGFNLEETRVTERFRIKRLLVVPVIAFCWAHRTWRMAA
jgi:hypothetical protein